MAFIYHWKGSSVTFNPKSSSYFSTIRFSLPAPKNMKTLLLLRQREVTHQRWQSVFRGSPRRPRVGRVMHPWGEELGEQEDSKVEPAAGGPWLYVQCPAQPPGPVLGVPWRKRGALGPIHCGARLRAARALLNSAGVSVTGRAQSKLPIKVYFVPSTLSCVCKHQVALTFIKGKNANSLVADTGVGF